MPVVYERRKSDFLPSNFVDYKDDQDLKLKNHLHKRFSLNSLRRSIKRDHESDESKYDFSFESSDYFNEEYLKMRRRSLQEMKNKIHDNIIRDVVAEQALARNDKRVHDEVRKNKIIQDDNISHGTIATDTSCISEKTSMTVTSAFTHANGNGRGFFSKVLDTFNSVKDGLALEIEAENAEQAQLKRNKNQK